MQINARLVIASELAGLTPDEIWDKTARDGADDGFSAIAAADDAWTCDSYLLHTAFCEDIDQLAAAPAFLGALVVALNEHDDLGLRELPASEGTVSATLSPGTIAGLLGSYRQERARVRAVLEGCTPVDDDLEAGDYLDYLDQWVLTLEIAERERAAIIVSAC